MSELTPVMKQYWSIKEEHSDAIVFFRLGDFYEMFDEDARVASDVLQIALTTRDKNKKDPMPMCGVPYFAADSYITKLINAGHKVAICEQVEGSKDDSGIVMREVVRVVTPGTHPPENQKENSFIMAITMDGKKHGIAVADVSTGEFFVYETDEPVEDELGRFEPREVIAPAALMGNIYYTDALADYPSTALEDFRFEHGEALRLLLSHFQVSSLEGFGIMDGSVSVSAAGALLSYLIETQRENLFFSRLSPLRESAFMFLDKSTQLNLELVHNLRDGSSKETLLWALDETLTPMGGRFLRNAVLRPLTELMEIRRRVAAVEWLFEDYELMETLRNTLRKVQDLERLGARVSMGTANARDLIAVRNALQSIPELKEALMGSGDPYIKSLGSSLKELPELKELITASVVEHPPLGLRDGGIIKKGYHPEVDELRTISTSGKDMISGIEAMERKKTGISTLKVGYNKVFGYYIEVTKANTDLVPEHYIRKQTLVSGERYITPELKDYEAKVLGAEERLKTLEMEVFRGVLDEAAREARELTETARSLATVDFLASLALVAKRNNYVMPHVNDGPVIKFLDCRHPVLERLPLGEKFIPNDVYMDDENDSLLIITGPNMAGKSTYMRQAALCVLMAQIGSFVPADNAVMGVVDRIFTRIGASDFLTKGQSTFMVEMIETSNILNNATPRSLIILDEVGRGTSTFDGISIAWATAEHIAKELGAKTLFATHYNELTELGVTLEGVRNFNVAVKEWGDEIIFLRKIEQGPADKSYGIQVARLAGLPQSVIGRAKKVLIELEKQAMFNSGVRGGRGGAQNQLDLFAAGADVLVKELLKLDPDKLTPPEALEALKSLRKKAGGQ